MFYRQWGKEALTSKKALLIHGLASSSLTWRTLASHLVGLGYEVLAPDLTGHGYSTRRESYSIDDWTDEVVALCDSLDFAPDLIIGHSIGGSVSANINNKHFDSKCVLLDPVFHLPDNNAVSLFLQRLFAVGQITRGRLFSATARRPDRAGLRRTLLVELSDLRKWDARTTQTLHQPAVVARAFIKMARNALLIRANRSLILPAISTFFLNDGVTIEHYRTSGHNIHKEAFVQLTESLDKFLATESALYDVA